MLFNIRLATVEDIETWVTLDKHIAKNELRHKIECGQCYVIEQEQTFVGVLRYGLFWDVIPFLNLIYFKQECRGRGLGRYAMDWWESRMRELGHQIVLTSTQSDEDAQHFYRKIGYKDAGCLILDVVPYAQPLELIMLKKLW